jgi:hypothetical protein
MKNRVPRPSGIFKMGALRECRGRLMEGSRPRVKTAGVCGGWCDEMAGLAKKSVRPHVLAAEYGSLLDG